MSERLESSIRELNEWKARAEAAERKLEDAKQDRELWMNRIEAAERDLRELEADVEQTYVPRAELEAAVQQYQNLLRAGEDQTNALDECQATLAAVQEWAESAQFNSDVKAKDEIERAQERGRKRAAEHVLTLVGCLSPRARSEAGGVDYPAPAPTSDPIDDLRSLHNPEHPLLKVREAKRPYGEGEKCPTCGGRGIVATSGPDEFGNYDTDDCPDGWHT